MARQEPRKWWLKIEYDFYLDKTTKILRRKCGELGIVLYQKMMLRSLADNFRITYAGLEESIAEEIATEIDEADVEAVERLLDFLGNHGLMVQEGEGTYYFPQAESLSSSEGASAERMRRHRGRASQSDGLSHSDGHSSQNSIIKEKQKQSNIQSYSNSYSYSSEYITDREEQSREEQSREEQAGPSLPSDRGAAEGGAAGAATASPRWSVSDLLDIRDRNKIDITDEGIKAFWAEREAQDWNLFGRPIDGITKALRGWVKWNDKYRASAAVSAAGSRERKQREDFTDEEMENQKLFPWDEIPEGAREDFENGTMTYGDLISWRGISSEEYLQGWEEIRGIIDLDTELISESLACELFEKSEELKIQTMEQRRDNDNIPGSCLRFIQFLDRRLDETRAKKRLCGAALKYLGDALKDRTGEKAMYLCD